MGQRRPALFIGAIVVVGMRPVLFAPATKTQTFRPALTLLTLSARS